MLSIVCFDMMPSAIKPEGSNNTISLFIVVPGVLVGYALIYLLNYLIDRHTNKEVNHVNESHPKTADDLDELIHSNHLQAHKEKSVKTNGQLFIAGLVMAIAIALHNIPEGMVMGSSFAANPNDILAGSGIIIAIVIGLHNIPEGMAVAVPLISGGMNKPKAVFITALSGLPTTLGAIIGYFLGLLSPIWLAISLSFAAGAMLYVVFGELLPESILMWKSKLPAIFMLFGLLVGFVLVYI
jgi:Predicted divalent heavy-metal cations transporter